MKVILLRDVARIGKKAEIKDVPDGHAINFLIPRKLAIPASTENVKRNQRVREQHNEQAQREREQFDVSISILSRQIPQRKVQANAQGHLFKGVSADDIIETCNAIDGVSLTKKQVSIQHPIKEVGVHDITVSHGGVSAVIQFEIIM